MTIYLIGIRNRYVALNNEQEMLKKEKEVIENAVKKGWDYNEEGLVQWMGEKYYNETFNTKEK
jgi:hypothetical protein